MNSEHLISCYDPADDAHLTHVTEEENFWTRDVSDSFAELLNVLPGMVYRCENDRQWTMLCISNDCIGLTGYTPQEFLLNKKLSFNDLIHPDDRDRVWRTVQAAVAEHKNFQIQYRIQHRDGHARWVWEQGCGAFDKHGKLTCVQGVVLEDSMRGLLEEKIATATNSQEYKTYVNSIAHDLGNLFSVIKNYANTIRRLKSYEPEEVQVMAHRIVSTTTKAADLLKQLLDLQEKDAEVDVYCQPAAVLQNLQPIITGLFDESVELRFHSSLTDWVILVNPSQLERAIVNLAINSARAMPDGGEVVLEIREVSLRKAIKCVNAYIPTGEYVCFHVQDSGLGMSENEVIKAFEPYHSTRAEGRGLGLPMVLAFSRKYLGGIQVESTPGSGTRFTLFVPRSLPEAV